jgi:hypothetical protein
MSTSQISSARSLAPKRERGQEAQGWQKLRRAQTTELGLLKSPGAAEGTTHRRTDAPG